MRVNGFFRGAYAFTEKRALVACSLTLAPYTPVESTPLPCRAIPFLFEKQNKKTGWSGDNLEPNVARSFEGLKCRLFSARGGE